MSSSFGIISNASSSIEIERLEGENRYYASTRIRTKAYSRSKNIVIANGENFPDALSANRLAAVLNVLLLLVTKNQIPHEVKAEIKRLGAKNIYCMREFIYRLYS